MVNKGNKMWLLRRNENLKNGHPAYVSGFKAKSGYTSSINRALKFSSKEEAKGGACGNENPVELKMLERQRLRSQFKVYNNIKEIGDNMSVIEKKPVDISSEQWDKSVKKARSYASRAFNVFPNKSQSFYISRVQNFIKADLIKLQKEGNKQNGKFTEEVSRCW